MIVRPVLDILRGVVVHGQGGQRENYQPIAGQLTRQSDPVAVALAIREVFGLSELYVADLDGILHQQPNFSLYGELVAEGFSLIVDAGVRKDCDARHVSGSGFSVRAIVGLETCDSPEELEKILDSSRDSIFSLDLVNGRPKRSQTQHGWSDDPCEIVRQVQLLSVNTILVLDLADVGMGTGGSTDELCQFIHRECPGMRLIAGGGVRGRQDLQRYLANGVDEVLVASAFHDGRLKKEDVHFVGVHDARKETT